MTKAPNAIFDVSGIKIAVDMAIADAGATSHFVLPGAPIKNQRVATNPLVINLPDGDVLRSSHVGKLDIPALPHKARVAHIVPGLAHSSLVSIKMLCDAGCKVEYDDEECTVRYGNSVVWEGVREPSTELWVLPLTGARPAATTGLPTPTPTKTANNAYQMTSKEALVRFIHQCLVK